MKQVINLNFSKDLTKLAGNKFGRTTYEQQVKDNINLDNYIVFVLPDRITRIASSFVQGFFNDIIKQIGFSGIEEMIEFKSSMIDFKDFVLKNLD